MRVHMRPPVRRPARSRSGRAAGRVDVRGYSPYNPTVPLTILEEMKGYIGFDDRDARRLRSLGPVVEPHLGTVVDRFYTEILRHPGARSVFVGGEAQVARQRSHLLNWLKTLFGGVYDATYAEQRAAIGQVHVRVGLPQHYMFTAMEVVRQELEGIILRAGMADEREHLISLQKLLAIETGMMLESYKESYTARVRQAEHDALEERVARAERLAEIGQLAASLAHEIKNPLAGISGAIQVIREELDAGDPHRDVLEQVLRQINRLDGTVKDLLTYSRPQALRLSVCRLDGLVHRLIGLLRREPAFAKLTLEGESGAGLTPVEADEHQLEQLLMNLLLNAAHASAPGGTVRLQIEQDTDEIVITVEDHGHGMDDSTRRRAFEPFFTTKARGTGLGLPICQRIVDAHGGALRLESRPGAGTVAEIRLPLRQAGGSRRENR